MARNPHDKALQRALLQYYDSANRDLCEEALRKAGRHDLIGFGEKCLIKPKNNSRPPIGQKGGSYGRKKAKR